MTEFAQDQGGPADGYYDTGFDDGGGDSGLDDLQGQLDQLRQISHDLRGHGEPQRQGEPPEVELPHEVETDLAADRLVAAYPDLDDPTVAEEFITLAESVADEMYADPAEAYVASRDHGFLDQLMKWLIANPDEAPPNLAMGLHIDQQLERSAKADALFS